MINNHLKIVVKLNSELETKYRAKDTYYSIRAQFQGMHFITLIFDNKKWFKRCITLKKGNKVYVSGQLGNYFNPTTKKNDAIYMLNISKFYRRNNGRKY